ncbi:MAG: hypothetical protein HY873_10030 [Chloroflexi bacterium]|nr:hypothetical protein [Chloroflexota bacterium]
MAVIAMNPFPNPQFPLITEEVAREGRRVYTYLDRTFPYAIQFITVPETEADDGAVLVLAIRRLRGR